MARPGIGKPRQAVTSYKDDLSGMWEKPTTKWISLQPLHFAILRSSVLTLVGVAGADKHGIRYVPAWSLGVIFQHVLAEMDDYMSTQQSIDNLGARPVPNATSFLMLLKKHPMFEEKRWTANSSEVIGATYV
ncbi:unnamed protein product [Symbiodinium sp. KB8]|nr:unnamed protein product [Symbiodinium sp. KB8]